MSLNINHLPNKLTISFPIWGLYDIDENGPYSDYDKMMKEHVERGFNCIRLDDGAGLMHDLSGNLRAKVSIRSAWEHLDQYMRQNIIFKRGSINIRKRLIDFFQAAKRHGIYIILSSWYFLHTYWYIDDKKLTDSIFAIPPHERYDAFAKYLHYILCELEKYDLDSQIAFAEIFNEADGLVFCGGYGNVLRFPDEELKRFGEEHTRAIAFLKENHPNIMFAYDISRPSCNGCLTPNNADVFNFHSYYMWSAYNEFESMHDEWLKEERFSQDEVKNLTSYPELMSEGWIRRVHFYSNLNPNKIMDAEKWLQDNFKKDLQKHRDKLEYNLSVMDDYVKQYFPDCPIVCGEGVSYCGAYILQWEEKCPEYWELLREAAIKYHERGLWGAVVRTCCGPEDPVWNMYPEKLLEINNLFRFGK